MTQANFVDFSSWRALEWDAAGRRLRGVVTDILNPGNDLFDERMTYDADDRVTRVVWNHANVGGTNVAAQEYEYDETGRLTKL